MNKKKARLIAGPFFFDDYRSMNQALISKSELVRAFSRDAAAFIKW